MDDKPTTPTEPTIPTTPVVPTTPTEPTIPTTPTKPEDSSVKLEGKSSEELVKMYGEAQKKLGEMSGEVGQSRELMKQMNVILAAISKDPEREKIVKNWITNLEKESDGAGKITPEEPKTESPEVVELRKTQEINIIRDFEKKYGIDQLEKEKREEMNGKIANALWVVADPLGKYEKYGDLVSAIPTSKLEGLLERAFYEMNKDMLTKAAMANTPGGDGAMGLMPSTSLPKEEVGLSKEEEETAAKLGISSEKYLARKKEKLGVK